MHSYSTSTICTSSRQEALRSGALYDISATARVCAQIGLPTAIAHRLWATLAPGEPFHAGDERIKEVCYALVFARVGLIPGNLLEQAGGLALRFEFLHRDKPLALRAVVHPTEDMPLVCTLLLDDEE